MSTEKFALTDKSDKAALLKHMQQYFVPCTKLPCQMDSFEDVGALTRWELDQYKNVLLPFWENLAVAYVQALAMPAWTDPGCTDRVVLKTTIEDWPQSFEAQQAGLNDLLQKSKLCMAWRGYCQWTLTQQTYYTDGQRQVLAELEREHAQGSRALTEIPLYQGWIRASCQQLICMPVTTWESMYCSSSRYQPHLIDRATVLRLATRVAQVFNTPPLAPLVALQESPSWTESVVWSTSQRGLTCDINSHGMTDRLEDDYGRTKTQSDSNLFPEWRYKGFCGQIRVTLEDGVPWYVTVLAPTHFVRRLALYANGLVPTLV